VRLWLQKFGAKSFVMAANHGAASGSVGVFDLGGPTGLVTELPLSPFPARAGSVGISAGTLNTPAGKLPMVFITNTWFALGGCSLPKGSVTAYDASLLETAGLMTEVGTVDTSGAIPYAVAVDEADGLAFVSNNCTNTLDTIEVQAGPLLGYDPPPPAGAVSIENTESRPVGKGPDATLYDPVRQRIYVNDINGHSISVYAPTGSLLATVPMGGPGPIDANLATGPKGEAWIVTSDGSNDSVSVIDRNLIEACIAAVPPTDTCASAVALTVKTKVPGGAPEGIDYDPVMNRIFTVNKNILSPSLSVIQLGYDADGKLTGEDIHQIPLVAIDSAVPVPALIAFDVVVEKP
jgi:DNA-binding beta-propeller fold protein YncE